MIVPHSRRRSIRLKAPLAAICLLCTVIGVIVAYLTFAAANSVFYYEARRRLELQGTEIKRSMALLKETENEYRKLFPLDQSSPDIDDAKNTGMIDMELMRKQVRQAVESVEEIKRYLRERHDLFLATPAGLPVDGHISSPFGPRLHPRTGAKVFHYGMDICVPPSTPVRATADGIVSFSGWLSGSGNTVVLEHGFGFNSAYAHNNKNLVKVGQRVKRGDVIVISGATGITTGPHLHYEVWKNGKQVDPLTYLKER